MAVGELTLDVARPGTLTVEIEATRVDGQFLSYNSTGADKVEA